MHHTLELSESAAALGRQTLFDVLAVAPRDADIGLSGAGQN